MSWICISVLYECCACNQETFQMYAPFAMTTTALQSTLSESSHTEWMPMELTSHQLCLSLTHPPLPCSHPPSIPGPHHSYIPLPSAPISSPFIPSLSHPCPSPIPPLSLIYSTPIPQETLDDAWTVWTCVAVAFPLKLMTLVDSAPFCLQIVGDQVVGGYRYTYIDSSM